MPTIVEYLDSGQIIATLTTPDPDIHESVDVVGGSSLVVGAESVDAHTSYVLNGQIASRQPFALQMTNTQVTADGIDECMIGNIPTGTTVEWPDGQTDEVTDGEVRFSVDLPGTYTLTFDAIPYLRQEVTIEAVAAT